MALIERFSPLGNLQDLSGTQLDDWSHDVEGLFESSIRDIEKFTKRGKSQFVDPAMVDVGADKSAPISWAGFPKNLAAQGLALDAQYKVADGFATDTRGESGRDVQDEYLEWYVHRDAQNDVVQIDFTTEGPEYWDRLSADLGQAGIVALYQKYYPAATAADLYPKGQYDHDNVFNTTRGAMHLRQRSNALSAEVEIAAQSTLTYTKAGKVLTDGGDLCKFAGLGEATRASDPHIAQTVNALARIGVRVSLVDPVGLYMDPAPDFTGWATPDSSDPALLWQSERGNPVTRGSLRSAAGFKLAQVTIAGRPILYGGQVAERITVHLTGSVSGPNVIPPTSVPVESLSQQRTALLSLSSGRLIRSRTGR